MKRIVVMVLALVGAATLGWSLSQAPGSALPEPDPCAGVHHIQWPDKNPVWEMCWLSPTASSGVDGSGLELRYVRYKKHMVLYRAHIPILNVKYDPGGCGGSSLSYRDGQKFLAPFVVDTVLASGPEYALTNKPVHTSLEWPGQPDKGKFEGVAVQKLDDCLVLTTHIPFGWYRYVHSWSFFPNGTIHARYGFSFSDENMYCANKPHDHHAYFRFDFDIDGSPDDVIEEHNPKKKAWNPLKVETSRKRDKAMQRKWRVRDKKNDRGYEIVPGAHDGVATPFAVADVWALRYHPKELDDGGADGSAEPNQAHLDKYLNKESIDGQDVVLWYRAGTRHAAAVMHPLGMEGPTLRPFGKW